MFRKYLAIGVSLTLYIGMYAAQQQAETKQAIHEEHASATSVVNFLPKELQKHVQSFFACPTQNKFYAVSKEFLPILLPYPCVKKIRNNIKKTDHIYTLIIRTNDVNYASDKRLTIAGKLSPRSTPLNRDQLDWHIQQNKTIFLTHHPGGEVLDKSVAIGCIGNRCYHKLNKAGHEFINRWEKELQEKLEEYRKTLAEDEAFFSGYSDNRLLFYVLPAHKRTIDALSIEQQEFLFSLFNASMIDSKKPIVLDSPQISTFYSFHPEHQERILANYPIEISPAAYLSYHLQRLKRYFTTTVKTHKTTCIFTGIVATTAISWLIWKRFHPKKS